MKPSPRRWRIAAAALMAAVIPIAGCALGSPGGGGTVTPATAILTPSPTPSLTQDQLDAEAERVFRLYFEEFVKLETAGGADQLPPAWSDYVTGEAYESFEELAREAKEEGRTGPPARSLV